MDRWVIPLLEQKMLPLAVVDECLVMGQVLMPPTAFQADRTGRLEHLGRRGEIAAQERSR